jgi:uncharacterized lipoprotein YddW (UPF0748 family)
MDTKANGMKKRVMILLLVVLTIGGCRQGAGVTPPVVVTPPPIVSLAPTSPTPLPSTASGAALPTATVEEPGPVPQAPASEMMRETRALWTWVTATATSESDVDTLVAQVDAGHLNVILAGVYRRGTAFFEPSQGRFPDARERLENRSRFVGAGYSDALSYLLAIRDKRRADADPANDFEVHAWFTVHRGGLVREGWPPQNATEPFMLNALFPEFKAKYGSYYTRNDDRHVQHAISAVEIPRFRQYMVDLIAGLAEDYPVDGIHLDYIRVGMICFNDDVLDYPGTEFDYPGCQEDYKAWTRETYGQAYTLWEDTDGVRLIQDQGSGRVAAWQVRTVGRLVQAIHQAVRAVRPEAIISVASVRNVPWELPVQGQVAWQWLDQGWIDAVFSTLYLDSTQPIVDRVGILREAIQDESKRQQVFAGLATYNFDDPDGEDWSDLILERVSALLRGEALEPPGKGVALFRGENLSPATLEALANGPFRQPALPYWGEVTD